MQTIRVGVSLYTCCTVWAFVYILYQGNHVQGCVQYRNVCKRFAKFPTSSRWLLRNVCKLFGYWTQPRCSQFLFVLRHIGLWHSQYFIQRFTFVYKDKLHYTITLLYTCYFTFSTCYVILSLISHTKNTHFVTALLPMFFRFMPVGHTAKAPDLSDPSETSNSITYTYM